MVMRNLEFGWFIPTRGDTDDYGEPLKIAAERAGFEYMLVPVCHQCWDAWMTGAMMTRKTTKMRMLVAARPSYINPVLLAKMVSTFDQLSEGRISINLIAGQSETENIAEGVHWSKEQRYEIMDEEVSILKALWTQTAPTELAWQILYAEEGRAGAQALSKALPTVLFRWRFAAGGGAVRQTFRRASVLGRYHRANCQQH
jgi:alkanesulfonate monooxygenase